MLHQIVQNGQSGIDRDRKPDPLIALLHQLAGGDADHLSVGVDQRAAAVAGVDRGICLNADHGIAQLGSDGPLDRRNIADCLGGSQRQTAGIADRNNHLADLQLIAVAEGGGDQSLGRFLHLQQGKVALVICADEGGIVAVAVLQDDLILLSAADHMGIGDDVAVFRKNDAAALCRSAAAVADDAQVFLIMMGAVVLLVNAIT